MGGLSVTTWVEPTEEESRCANVNIGGVNKEVNMGEVNIFTPQICADENMGGVNMLVKKWAESECTDPEFCTTELA